MRRALLLLLLLIPFAFAQDEVPTDVVGEESEETFDIEKYFEDLENSFSYQTGKVPFLSGKAEINTTNMRFLGAEDAQSLLENGWGNPPDSEVLGMLIPKDVSPFDDKGWGVVISYSDEGYVSDKEASKTNFDTLLKDMQASTEEDNKAREEAGYENIKLVGWATAPRYDSTSHKLHWAEELEFGGDSAHTLNYNIRVLGRYGYLNLNSVGSMEQLPEIQAALPGVLGSVSFRSGNRYEDFNNSTDRVAKYGIAALIAGGVLAKKGFLAVIIAVLAKFAKVIIVGVIAAGGAVARMFGRSKSQA
jgi:uncharacterized membrane-anchored protein